MTSTRLRRARSGAVVVVLMSAAGAALVQRTGFREADIGTAVVRQGEFEDVVTLRGEVRPVRSITLSAPTRGGELRILRIARTGTAVNAGDTVIEFDRSFVLNTFEEKRSELKRAEAELDRIRAQRQIAEQEIVTEVQKARFDLERARLDTRGEEFASRVDIEQRRLAVADAESTLRALEEKLAAERKSAQAELAGVRHKRDKARREVEEAEGQLKQLSVIAPAPGVITILPNFRASGAGGAEFREGDRPWNGAPIAELPDLAQVLVTAKLDESERARLREGVPATVRVDAIPDRDFTGRVKQISALTRADFTTWPPARNFEATIELAAADRRLRPGMNATARVTVDRVSGATLVPVKALFNEGTRTICYVRSRAGFTARDVAVSRRGSDEAIVSGLRAGDIVATERPKS